MEKIVQVMIFLRINLLAAFLAVVIKLFPFYFLNSRKDHKRLSFWDLIENLNFQSK